ncbi:MAG: DUF2293 domain-containing protein [Candidatus Dormibacteraceae bacterium]
MVTEQPRKRAADLVVINPQNKNWMCHLCHQSGWLLKMEDAGPTCMNCADLDHLVFLPAGDTALTRRARQRSALSAVVVRFSRTRRRYERQGVLIEEAALERAETECLADSEARASQRIRAEERRQRLDAVVAAEFATAVLELFPHCPEARARAIAEHAGVRGSGRVGRSAAGRALDDSAIVAAVTASIRHKDTRYDRLLMEGMDRGDARRMVSADIEMVLAAWSA